MTTLIDRTGRTWKRPTNPHHLSAGLWYSSAGTMTTFEDIYTNRGPLTVKDEPHRPLNICPCCANYIVNGDDCEHYPCHAGEPYKYIDVTRVITVHYDEWNDRVDIECDSCGVESDYYGGLYRGVSKHYLES